MGCQVPVLKINTFHHHHHHHGLQLQTTYGSFSKSPLTQSVCHSEADKNREAHIRQQGNMNWSHRRVKVSLRRRTLCCAFILAKHIFFKCTRQNMIKVPHHPADVSGVGTCTVHAIKRQNKSRSVKVSHCSVSFGHRGNNSWLFLK